MHASVRDYWLEFNRPLEGRVPFMYLDVKGFVSTGVGNLIDATARALVAPTDAERSSSHAIARQLNWLTADGSPASAAAVDAEWDLVKSRLDLAPKGGGWFRPPLTSLHITGEEIDRYVFAKLDQMEASLKARSEFAAFDSWPADAQLGLLSMAWGMGPAFRFPSFQAHASAGDFAAAADECRFNPNIGTIILRNDRDQQLFRNAAAVTSGGQDIATLVYPGSVGAGPEPTTEPEPAPEPDLSTTRGLFDALQQLGVTPEGLDDASLAAAVDELRQAAGLEPTGTLDDSSRDFVREQLASILQP